LRTVTAETVRIWNVCAINRRKPELCYRVIPETETNLHKNEEDTVDKLRKQDARNKEIAIEKGVEEVKRFVRENIISTKDFSVREQELLYFILFSFLRKENYGKFSIKDGEVITDEAKMELIAFRSIEQENVLRRDFIIYALSQASCDGLKSKLLLEFATFHFPDRVAEIKRQCNETYRKKHERIEERIRELQPYNGENAVATAIEPKEESAETTPIPEGEETFDNPDTDDIPVYPGLPEQAEIGEIPEEDWEIMEAVYEEFAA
jgi:ParB family chromosome partitioning protein